MKFNSAFLYTATAAIIWGATAPIMKLTLTQVPIFSLIFIRMGIASLILAFFLYKKLRIKKEDIKSFIYASITGISLHMALFFIALKLTSAMTVALIVATVPILTLFAAHLYLREKITNRLIFASAVALLGAIIIIGNPFGHTTLIQTIGNFLLLGSALMIVIAEIITKKLLKKYEASVVSFYTMAIGSLSVLPVALWEFWQNPAWIGQITYVGLAGILFGILFASLIAYTAWYKGLSLMPTGEASFFFYLDPVSGVIFSIILLGEKITSSIILGGVFVAIGVFLAEHKRKAHPLHSRVLN